MTVSELIAELRNYPHNSEINITSTYAYPYSEASTFKIEYTAMVEEAGTPGLYAAGNDITDPFDAPMIQQHHRLVHFIVK